VEILSGLKEGDRVVVSAQFLLDSESSLRAELQRMSTETAPHAHSGDE
jgi:membrane fusion protein, copper/silver efflux system